MIPKASNDQLGSKEGSTVKMIFLLVGGFSLERNLLTLIRRRCMYLDV